MTASVLGVGLALGALDTGDKVASLISCLVGVVTLGLTWVTSRVPSRVNDTLETSAFQSLSKQMAEHVRREATGRHLLFPEPLRVPWSSVNGPAAASPDVVLGRLSGVRRTALHLCGDVTTLADTVAALPARQVVILGDEGAGKTSTALLLALRLIDEGRIPLLIDLAGWAADLDRLDEYLVRCLRSVLPAGLSVEVVRAVASRLVDSEKLIPVLDGLDEMPSGLRELVIKDVQTWNRPFVLTSQPLEYETAVRAAGVTAARALVVRLAPMPVPEIIAHLTAGRADTERRWSDVVARLHKQDGGPLGEVLSSPLMSGLARTAYTPSDSDPDELLSLDTADAVERHLMDVVYRRDEPLTWLAGLAGHLTRLEMRHMDLSGPLTPAGWGRHRRRAVSFLVTACAGWFAAFDGRHIDWSGPLYDTIAAIAAWIAILVGYMILRLAYRSRADIATPFRLKITITRMLRGAASAVGFATVLNLMVLLSPNNSPDLSDPRLVAGIITITLLIAVLGVFGWGSLTETVADNEVSQPLATLRRDRIALVAHFPLPIIGTAAYCATIGGWTEFYGTLVLSLLASTIVRNQVPGLAWSRWVLWRLLLFRRIPTHDRSLGEALEDARTRGILRASGTSYRFQHAKIHDYLARSEGALSDL
nr:hypothetical protein [Kibdelosporangium sp. MJ126-NF4]